MSVIRRFIRRGSTADLPRVDPPPPPPTSVLPKINRRVAISIEGGTPEVTRIEDVTSSSIVVSAPGSIVELGDEVTLSWDEGNEWNRLITVVDGVSNDGRVPVISLSRNGAYKRFREGKTEVQCSIALPLQLRVVMGASVSAGTQLTTHTVAVAEQSLRFLTGAPFTPGDVVEARLLLNDIEYIPVRLRIIRVDNSIEGSWKNRCVAVYDEILASSRLRLTDYLKTAAKLSESDTI